MYSLLKSFQWKRVMMLLICISTIATCGPSSHPVALAVPPEFGSRVVNTSSSLPLLMEDRYDPYSKIVIGCNCLLEDGSKAECQWVFTPPLEYELLGDPMGSIVHVWAKPGRYSVKSTTVVKQEIMAVVGYKEDKTPIIKKMTVITDYLTKFGEFTVGDAPPPGPDPGPGPKPNPVPKTDFGKDISIAIDLIPQADRDREIVTKQGDGHVTKKPSKFLIAEIYESIGSDAKRNPTSWTHTRMRADLDQRVSQMPAHALNAWRPFFVEEQKAWKKLGLDASDVAKHADGYIAIAEVLNSK